MRINISVLVGLVVAVIMSGYVGEKSSLKAAGTAGKHPLNANDFYTAVKAQEERDRDTYLGKVVRVSGGTAIENSSRSMGSLVVMPVSSQFEKKFSHLLNGHGVQVQESANPNIRPGDVLLAIDKTKIGNMADLARTITEDDFYELTLGRINQTGKIQLTPATVNIFLDPLKKLSSPTVYSFQLYIENIYPGKDNTSKKYRTAEKYNYDLKTGDIIGKPQWADIKAPTEFLWIEKVAGKTAVFFDFDMMHASAGAERKKYKSGVFQLKKQDGEIDLVPHVLRTWREPGRHGGAYYWAPGKIAYVYKESSRKTTPKLTVYSIYDNKFTEYTEGDFSNDLTIPGLIAGGGDLVYLTSDTGPGKPWTHALYNLKGQLLAQEVTEYFSDGPKGKLLKKMSSELGFVPFPSQYPTDKFTNSYQVKNKITGDTTTLFLQCFTVGKSPHYQLMAKTTNGLLPVTERFSIGVDRVGCHKASPIKLFDLGNDHKLDALIGTSAYGRFAHLRLVENIFDLNE